ncbi:hypothetical protein ACLQ24_29915 [Micromonospora sp. DT4]|uniref:hypothetical protein n=1 Tax=Micromonospora sp. DT4 TaxID=3393438 RepID=UPI003CF0E1BD
MTEVLIGRWTTVALHPGSVAARDRVQVALGGQAQRSTPSAVLSKLRSRRLLPSGNLLSDFRAVRIRLTHGPGVVPA